MPPPHFGQIGQRGRHHDGQLKHGNGVKIVGTTTGGSGICRVGTIENALEISTVMRIRANANKTAFIINSQFSVQQVKIIS